jgi:phage gpG-like protein
MIMAQLVGDRAVIAHLEATPHKVMGSVKSEVSRLALALLIKVKNEKLSGRVLKNKTGTLRASINQRVIADSNSVTGSVGTNIVYAAAHEFGFKGPVTVKAHLRMVKVAFGKAVKNPAQHMWGSFTRQMNLPERSFLRSALHEMSPEIQAGLQNAIRGAL